MSQSEYEDDYETAAQRVLQCHWLLMEIAQYHYSVYRAVSQLNRKGGVLALDQSLYYRSWRNELKRRSFTVIRHGQNWAAFGPNLVYNCEPGPSSCLYHHHEYFSSTDEKYSRKSITLTYASFGSYELNLYDPQGWHYGFGMTSAALTVCEKGVTRSKDFRIRKTEDKKEIAWVLTQFEKYRNGPFPPITE